MEGIFTIRFLPIFFIGFFIVCCHQREATPVSRQFSIKEELEIGGSDTSDNQPLLSFISDAVSDSTGNVYLFDPQTQQIHAYGREGSHLWTGGGKGSGPGEFKRISDLFVGNRGHLFVYDWEKTSITQFNTQGELSGNWSFKAGMSINHIRPITGQRFLVPYLDNDKLIHIYSNVFSEHLVSLVPIRDVLQTDNELEKEMIESNPGSALLLDEGLIAYVPHHYAGSVYIYEETTPGEWEKTGTMEGYRQIEKTVSIRTTQSVEADRSHFIQWTPKGYNHFEFHSISFGLFHQADGSVVHLSYLSGEEGMRMIVERFDTEQLRLEDYGMVDTLNISHQYRKEPVWMDQTGHIYLANNSGLPQLRKLKLVVD